AGGMTVIPPGDLDLAIGGAVDVLFQEPGGGGGSLKFSERTVGGPVGLVRARSVVGVVHDVGTPQKGVADDGPIVTVALTDGEAVVRTAVNLLVVHEGVNGVHPLVASGGLVGG